MLNLRRKSPRMARTNRSSLTAASAVACKRLPAIWRPMICGRASAASGLAGILLPDLVDPTDPAVRTDLEVQEDLAERAAVQACEEIGRASCRERVEISV